METDVTGFFDPRFFQNNFFQTEAGVLNITDTDVLQKPVNCVLAGQKPYKDRWREHEIHEPRRRAIARGARSGVGKLKGNKPSFKVTTDKKGYD